MEPFWCEGCVGPVLPPLASQLHSGSSQRCNNVTMKRRHRAARRYARCTDGGSRRCALILLVRQGILPRVPECPSNPSHRSSAPSPRCISTPADVGTGRMQPSMYRLLLPRTTHDDSFCGRGGSVLTANEICGAPFGDSAGSLALGDGCAVAAANPGAPRIGPPVNAAILCGHILRSLPALASILAPTLAFVLYTGTSQAFHVGVVFTSFSLCQGNASCRALYAFHEAPPAPEVRLHNSQVGLRRRRERRL
ncbi:hypothetical protein B0H17DRAFT_1324185 [Mycena rosella]|uniref:Uncharacterized protein n=1 Tax=Mycena rosella TaxID=1033263 RepID=A0AAD7MCC7_MYCRO|nr:hypothetical protein B0H17DRAFT_1324185 [Mycena rosella]